ncbi:MAG TPA: glycosyltransferase family 2 protein [Puia sp.]
MFYNYIGYVIPVLLLNRLSRKSQPRSQQDLPTVSFIVAAFNEEDCITQKIANCLIQDYPADRIEWIFVSDGSTDNTEKILRQYPSIRSMHRPERKGKSAAMSRAAREARHEILIFSDANTILNKEAVQNIARHYADPKTGGVAGEKKVLHATGPADEVGESEGLYWKYESFLKKADAAFYSVVGAAGELFSIRTSLFEELPSDIILDDFVSSLKVAQKGYRIAYEPDACATELPSFSIGDEQKRKIRIAAGGFQAMGILTPLLAFWKYPRLSYLYISHRVLRWTLSPLCMILAFISNGVLVFIAPNILLITLFTGQLAFYGMALAGSLSPSLKQRSKTIKLAAYFTFMNISVILGFFRFLRGKQTANWEKARRAV